MKIVWRVAVQTIGFMLQGYAFEMASHGTPKGMYWFMVLGFGIIVLGGRIGLKSERD